MEKKINFYSEGLKISAVLFTPDDLGEGEKRPGLVLCQGFTGIKEAWLPSIAKRFAEAGYIAMIFDYRYFGESEGEPRWQVLPLLQVQDTKNAITFLQCQPSVDPDKIGLYGESFGAGIASYTAAVDDRAKCTTTTIGVGNGERWLMGLRPYWQWHRFLKRVEQDRVNRVLTGKSEYVDTIEVMPLSPEEEVVWNKLAKHAVANFPQWGTKVTLESVEAVIEFRPEDVVDRISPRAIQWLAAGEDECTPVAESVSMYQRAKEPKNLVIIEGLPHGDAYRGEGFEKVMKYSLEWYQKWIPIESGA